MISCSNVSILQYQHCLYFLSRTVIIMNMRNALSATRQTLQVTPQQRTPEAARHAPLDSSKTSRGTAPVSTAKQILSQRLARLPYLNADANRASPTPGGTHHAPPVLRASSSRLKEVHRVLSVLEANMCRLLQQHQLKSAFIANPTHIPLPIIVSVFLALRTRVR